jgi:hypothetical protein
MSDVKPFLDEMLPRIHEAETALHNGDAGPRFEMWSHTDPVTVFGAAFSPVGWAEVGPMFERLASHFSNCRSCVWEVVAADVGEDFAYLLAIERTTASVGGSEPTPRERRVEDRASPCRSARPLRRVAVASAPRPVEARRRLCASQQRGGCVVDCCPTGLLQGDLSHSRPAVRGGPWDTGAVEPRVRRYSERPEL